MKKTSSHIRNSLEKSWLVKTIGFRYDESTLEILRISTLQIKSADLFQN